MNNAKTDLASENCGAGSGQPQHPAIGGVIGPGIGEIVKRLFGHPDDVGIHKRRAFAGAVFGVFQAAFPFDDGPTVEAVLREFREDAAEIDLSAAR